jgi:CheY-like chemotaxis protein
VAAGRGPEVLVLEDDPWQCATLVAIVRDLFLSPLGARTPDQALAELERHRPVLALVDLDMSLVSGGQHGVEEVLCALYQSRGGCCTLVYSVWADDLRERKRVEQVHPLATFLSKREGQGALVERVRRMVGVRFGDLVLRRGVVFHWPSRRSFGHRVAVSLLLGAANGHEVVVDEVEARAVRRLSAWLTAVGSGVQVVDYGRRRHGLCLADGGLSVSRIA